MARTEHIFRVSPLDPAALLPQVSRALETRTQLISRARLPAMWRYIDRLNGAEKAPEQTLKKRRTRARLRGILLLALGVFLFVPGLMEPRELTVPLLAGAAAILLGIASLWRSGAGRKDRFAKPAEQLLEGKDRIPEGRFQIVFSPEGMTIEDTEDGASGQMQVPYSDFEYVIETADLLLLTYNGQAILLQKRDLASGDFDGLRAFLSERTAYAPAITRPPSP